MIPREGKRARAERGGRSPVMARAERVSAKATGTRGVRDNPAKMDARCCAFVGYERSELTFRLLGDAHCPVTSVAGMALPTTGLAVRRGCAAVCCGK